MVVESARANWFVLDSLERTTATPGRVGPEQLKWLPARSTRAGQAGPGDGPPRPHARHQFRPARHGDLMEIIKPRKQVKVLFFGHTHDWEVASRTGFTW